MRRMLRRHLRSLADAWRRASKRSPAAAAAAASSPIRGFH
eukprot:gene9362-15011_t